MANHCCDKRERTRQNNQRQENEAKEKKKKTENAVLMSIQFQVFILFDKVHVDATIDSFFVVKLLHFSFLFCLLSLSFLPCFHAFCTFPWDSFASFTLNGQFSNSNKL